jgi:hypothetical protein
MPRQTRATCIEKFIAQKGSQMSVKRISHVDIGQHVPISGIVAVALEIQTLRQKLGLPASAAMARILAS